MAKGTSLANITGKVYLNEPMVACNLRGVTVLRRYVKYKSYDYPLHKKVRGAFGEFSIRWAGGLTNNEQGLWEFYAKGLCRSYYEWSKKFSTSLCDIFHSSKKGIFTGRNAYIGSNILAILCEFATPKDKPPIGYSALTPPSDVTLSYENGIARVRWLDPNLAEPAEERCIRMCIKLAGTTELPRKRYYRANHIIMKFDIPTSGEFQFSSVRVTTKGKSFEIPLSDFRSGTLCVQMDTVVAYKKDTGARRSFPSNMAVERIRKIERLED